MRPLPRRGPGGGPGPQSEHSRQAALNRDGISVQLAEAVLIATIALVDGHLDATPPTVAALRRLIARLERELADVEWRLEASAAA